MTAPRFALRKSYSRLMMLLVLSSLSGCGQTCRDQAHTLPPPGAHHDEEAAKLIHRSSSSENGSRIVKARSSSSTVMASAKRTLCLAKFVLALAGSHSWLTVLSICTTVHTCLPYAPETESVSV